MINGSQMKAIRLENHLTPREFAVALGYTGSRHTLTVQVNRFESDRRTIPPTIQRLTYMFGEHGVPPTFLTRHLTVR